MLGGYHVVNCGPGRCASQRAVQVRALKKASRWCYQLHELTPAEPDFAWTTLIHDDRAHGAPVERPPLVADRCDLLDPSGQVDPLPFATDAARDNLSSGSTLFSNGDLNHVRAAPIRRDDREEYARLVVRQLRCQKVMLLSRVDESASVFTVGKSNGAPREVWNGHTLSQVAVLLLVLLFWPGSQRFLTSKPASILR